MRFPKTLPILVLAIGLAFAPSAGAQRNVGPSGAGPRPNAVRPYVACATMLAMPAGAQQKPFTQEQINNMVRDGFGDESGAKLIEQRGIDFAPSEDFIQTLKAAGASEAFLNALRAAKPPEPASAKKPINQVQVFALLVGQVPSHRVSMLVQKRGIDFEPTDEYLQEVRLAGGEEELIAALKGAKVTKRATVDPAEQARQTEVRRHVARGAELERKGQYAEAEQECRAALLLDSQNADVYVGLAYILLQQKKWDDAESAAREAVRLSPNSDAAHNNLGAALGHKGDCDAEIAEEREALRLNPNNDAAHLNLGVALASKGDWDGDIAEEREALRLNPNNEVAHNNLGVALGSKGDLDGAIAEYREALRLSADKPDTSNAHLNLGVALVGKGDWDDAIIELREAIRIKPGNENAHAQLGVALEDKGDLEGAIREYRVAIRLNPKHEFAHQFLGEALARKADWDGAMAEEREALRLNRDNGLAHFCLGYDFEAKGDLQSALQEYRAAYELDPKDPNFRRAYERLVQQQRR